ncbi:MAG TPA: hypothetical protein VK187_00555 [Geobacteraceae bacterium]|nr:hypothetical protein [Geobacteraceae bacterium]
MKKALLLALGLMMLVTAGCGSDTTVAFVTPSAPPSIAALQFTQDRTTLFVTGSVEFLAPDVDLDVIVITAINSKGFAVSQTTTDLTFFAGQTFGIIPFAIDYAVFPSDTYTFTVFVTDLAGSFSNQLVGTFQVP